MTQARAATARARVRRFTTRSTTIALNLVTAAAMFIALGAAGLIVGTSMTGHHLETVVTGSMQPQIPIGSLVLTQRVPASQLAVGDIIVFPAPCQPGKIVVHRIVQESTNGAGQVLIHTKGDANPVVDQWLSDCAAPTSTGALTQSATAPADRVVYILPVVGNALDAGRRLALILLLLTGGLVVLQVGIRELRRAVKKKPAGA